LPAHPRSAAPAQTPSNDPEALNRRIGLIVACIGAIIHRDIQDFYNPVGKVGLCISGKADNS
jgi:hypothetical protein